MADERDDAPRVDGVGREAPRVYDIRAWAARPTVRKVGAPRALWARGAADRPPTVTPAPITPVRHVPVRTAGAPAAAPARPVVLIGCAESPALDRLAAGLGATSVLRNLGGISPRSPHPRLAPGVLEEALESALHGGHPLHVVCVGHLGCHAIRASARYAATGGHGEAPERAARAVEHHVFLQVHRVRTYLRRRGRHPEVLVSGLWVDEATGHVRAFDPTRRAFAPLTAFDLRPFAAAIPARAD
ncbi:hypothetical protein TBR22_A10580 [Luteitalea sp. TBR-22]|uniref:hypothetical protein n=1 Tax=Luteitalea sp. TBR-22 TaxID=2802971 RepID=UPI001AF21AE0|nr:hypothetical protein [Luteitalea sp. TBR-22]BCS31855.1 hypothetical protein TBR22_A10580 [Luteitalea sp. TBR-22]